MAHTIEELVMNIADKYAVGEEQHLYQRYKEMLWEFLEELHHPVYIEKLIEPNFKEL